jgi:predicted GNAT family acetyltransferase
MGGGRRVACLAPVDGLPVREESVHARQLAVSHTLPLVRRLREGDQAALQGLLGTDPGYSIFLQSHLEQYGVRSGAARYWGMFTHGRLAAALMLVERRAALYAQVGVDIQPLANVAAEQGVEFTMGRADLVASLLAASSHLRVDRREDHVFAELAPRWRRKRRPASPRGTVVRRGVRADIEALTRLYTGAAGFEGLAGAQIREAMRGRVEVLRTYLAEVDGQVVAAASTSAETRMAAMIGGVWTDPAWRSRGLSTAVVAALSGELLGERRVPYLFYLVNNIPAARVYARIGYRPIGWWTVVYFDGRDSA